MLSKNSFAALLKPSKNHRPMLSFYLPPPIRRKLADYRIVALSAV